MDVEQRARAVFGLSWADYWMERGQPDVAHDFDAFSRAEAWALQRFTAALTPPEDAIERAAKALHAHGADNLCNDVLWDDLHQSEADQFLSWARAALIAARPEVPDGRG